MFRVVKIIAIPFAVAKNAIEKAGGMLKLLKHKFQRLPAALPGERIACRQPRQRVHRAAHPTCLPLAVNAAFRLGGAIKAGLFEPIAQIIFLLDERAGMGPWQSVWMPARQALFHPELKKTV